MPVSTLSDALTKILTTNDIQQSLELAEQTSQLEDLNHLKQSCLAEESKQKACEDFADSQMPEDYKKNGWKVLFEIKYEPLKPGDEILENEELPLFRTPYLMSYRYYEPDQEKPINTLEELNKEAQKISKELIDRGRIASPETIRNELILDQITNAKYYENITDLKQKNEIIFNRLKELSEEMSDEDYLRLISGISHLAKYNYSRQNFNQKEGAQGLVTPFEILTNTKAGICGDIHSAAAKMGEIRGWESFTVGYAVNKSQHVVTAMVDPKNPDKLMLVNYSSYEEHPLNDGNSILLTPSASNAAYRNDIEDLGIQIRIFKNNQTADPLGKMQQINTIPTALGSLLNGLFLEAHHIVKSTPQNENYRNEKMKFQKTKEEVFRNKKNQLITKATDNGLIVYEGETENAQVYGVGVSRDVYKHLYYYDEKLGKCVPKRSKYFSLGVAGNVIDLKNTDFNQTFYAYLNIKGGKIFHLYQTEFFQFKGIIGYQFDGFLSFHKKDQIYDKLILNTPNQANDANPVIVDFDPEEYRGLLTGDANFSSFLGLVANYQKRGTQLHSGAQLETVIGLRDQNLMTDLSPKNLLTNVDPISFNALSFTANFNQKINNKASFSTQNNLSLTRVGGRVILSSGIILPETSIMLSYQGGVKAIPVGNSLQHVNLYRNFNNTDGVRVTVTRDISNKDKTISTRVSGYIGASTSTAKMQPIFGTEVKANLNPPPAKKVHSITP